MYIVIAKLIQFTSGQFINVMKFRTRRADIETALTDFIDNAIDTRNPESPPASRRSIDGNRLN